MIAHQHDTPDGSLVLAPDPGPTAEHAARLLAEAAVMASLHRCTPVQVADALWAAGVPADVGGVAKIIQDALESTIEAAYDAIREAAEEAGHRLIGNPYPELHDEGCPA